MVRAASMSCWSKMRRPKADHAEDVELWRRVARDIAPLPGRTLHPDRGRLARNAARTAAVQSAAPAAPTNPAAPPPPPNPPAKSPPPAPPPLDNFAGVDRATAERLKRGRRAIE